MKMLMVSHVIEEEKQVFNAAVKYREACLLN